MRPPRPAFLLCHLLAGILLALALPLQAFWGFEGERREWTAHVWEAPLPTFEESSYVRSVDALMAAFERSTGKNLAPGALGRVGIKIYTNSGPGLDTPHALTRAVIQGLVKRGYDRERLLIVDSSASSLREAGYLPPLSARGATAAFDGVPVVAIDSRELFDEKWFYESPVPASFFSPLGRSLLQAPDDDGSPEQRRSLLPATLLTGVDFWINLPMVTDHRALGVNGALVNATLWNVGNRDRFFSSPANAPVAVAEIAAIPEMLDTWGFTLMTLERYQFIGGPEFNSFYTESEAKIWLAVDPVILDALILQRINARRERWGFQPLGVLLPMLDYAAGLGVGAAFFEQTRMHAVDPWNQD
ncbi:MAG: DUF362 domain-containing protein [Opitutales bacterium]